MSTPPFYPFLERVSIRNFKSIERCDVSLGPLTFLVGPNGSGKSNFLDALDFLADALRFSPNNHGKRGWVFRYAGEEQLSIGLRIRFSPTEQASYDIVLADPLVGDCIIVEERCRVETSEGVVSYRVENGKATVESPAFKHFPRVPKKRFYLTSMLAEPAFEALHTYLTSICLYDLNPGAIKGWQLPEAGMLLAYDGSNAAGVWKTLSADYPEVKRKLENFLVHISADVRSVETITPPGGVTQALEFEKNVSDRTFRFLAESMSDGTIRAFGMLLALFQRGTENDPISLIMIEEPEGGIHPAAMQVMLDAILDAATQRQVIITTHSPDLLDRKDVDPDSILVATSEKGKTLLGPIDEASRSVVRDRLYYVGELLRIGQIETKRD